MDQLHIQINGCPVTVRDCVNKVVRFCEYDAYEGYDVKGRQFAGEPDVFQRDLLAATNGPMRARSRVEAWHRFIGQPIRELALISQEADLLDLSDEQYSDARSRLKACYNLLTGDGIGDVAASKMLHLKRPKLAAISDMLTKRALGVSYNLSYVDQAMAVTDRVREVGLANKQLLCDLQEELAHQAEPIVLSRIRLLDILIWTYMSREYSLYQRLFDAGCVKFGEFKLKSGIMSPLYVDLRMLVSSPRLLAQIGEALADRAREIGCDRVAGIPYGGLPVGVAASLASGIPMIYPRKEVKEHGTAKRIEGEFKPGEKVLVIDDLITDGASKIEAIEPLEQAGLVVKDVLVILDREQGGDKLLANAGYTLHSLGKLSDVLDALVSSGKVASEMRARVGAFVRENQFT